MKCTEIHGIQDNFAGRKFGLNLHLSFLYASKMIVEWHGLEEHSSQAMVESKNAYYIKIGYI